MINKYKAIPWFLVILWMVLIFYLSHQPVERSKELSNKVTDITIKVVEEFAPNAEFNPRRLNHLVRKNAHFFSYLFLGFLVMNILRISGINGHRGILMALIISILYAISDEVHQLFIPGRGGQLRDVIIDSLGAGTGILIYKLVKRLNKN